MLIISLEGEDGMLIWSWQLMDRAQSKKYIDSVHWRNSWSFISPHMGNDYHPTKKTMMAHWTIACLQFMPLCSWTKPFSWNLMQCWSPALQHTSGRGFWGMPWQVIKWVLLSVHMSSPLHLAPALKWIVCTAEASLESLLTVFVEKSLYLCAFID